MSAPMKARPIKNEVKIQVGERKTRLFLVPKDRAEGVVKLLQDFEVKSGQHTMPWRDPIKGLIEKYSDSGVSLKGARAKEGMSQNELAEKLGIPQSHISDYETGRRSIGKKMAKRLARVFKVDFRVFL